MQQIGIRLPPDLLEQLDTETERRNRETPGAGFVRADVIRILLSERLADITKRRR